MRHGYKNNTKGWSNYKIAYIFSGMKQRCYNPNCKSYPLWGGKGIKICDEWLNDPKKFDIWAINNGWQDGLTIDRIDSKGNYTPENCRWVTREDNGRNIAIASMSYIVVNNISKTGKDWSKYLNLGANTINTYRKVYGIDIVKKFIKARMEDMSKEKAYNTESWLTIYNII